MATAIAFRFPGGRYHATPTGRNVNEADVEWPPSPRRILRALIATWHRKADPEEHPESVLSSLVERLAEELPVYRLPAAVLAHTRHYMPIGRLEKGREKTSLIFDAFARVSPTDELVASWPGCTLEAQERTLLASLLNDLGYLGRAESWVEARLLDDWQGEPNASPSEVSVNLETGETTEPVELIVPLPPRTYAAWREETVAQRGLTKTKLKVTEKQLLATLPEDYLDMLRLENGYVQKAGWSRAPGSRTVLYQRPPDALRGSGPTAATSDAPPLTTVRLVLAGRPLPRIEDAVRIGELIRKAAIHQAEKVPNTRGVPSALSGHDLPDDNLHGHAFYLPEDADRDGYIDHLLVYAADGLSPHAVSALDRIERIWNGKDGEWRVAIEGYGNSLEAVGSTLGGSSTTWVSTTPYLHPWYVKNGFGIEQQVERECRRRELQLPVRIERLPTITVRNRPRRSVHFHRFRSKRGLRQPDTQGCFLRLTFAEPVTGPLALGFGCHYGLGMFAMQDDSR